LCQFVDKKIIIVHNLLTGSVPSELFTYHKFIEVGKSQIIWNLITDSVIKTYLPNANIELPYSSTEGNDNLIANSSNCRRWLIDIECSDIVPNSTDDDDSLDDDDDSIDDDDDDSLDDDDDDSLDDDDDDSLDDDDDDSLDDDDDDSLDDNDGN